MSFSIISSSTTFSISCQSNLERCSTCLSVYVLAARDSFGNLRDKAANVVATCNQRALAACGCVLYNILCIPLDLHYIIVIVRSLSRALAAGHNDRCFVEHFSCNTLCQHLLRYIHSFDITGTAIEIVRIRYYS